MDPINDYRICALPDLRVLVSKIKDEDGEVIDDMRQGMGAWADANGIPRRLGVREEFAYFDEEDRMFVFLRRLPEGFTNSGPYPERMLPGGLVAVVSGERDHLVERYNMLMEWLAESDRYDVDAVAGKQRHETLVDWLTPRDIHLKFDFEQQDIIIPIRLRRHEGKRG